MEDYIALLNEANRNLGLINTDITEDTIETLNGLTEAQQRALFDQLYLIAEQRGHENIFSADMNNFRAFLIDISTEFGWTIEDYMLEVLDGVTPQWHNDGEYTDAQQAENLVKDYEQKVKGTFHARRFSKQFPTTIRDYEYKKSFYPSKVGAFIDRKIGMLNTSAEIYLQNSVLIDEVKQMITDGDMVIKKGHSVNNSNGILKMLETLKTDYSAFSTPVNSYNKDEVISITPYDDLKFIVTKQSVLNRIKVREYAGAFNLEQMKLEGRIITVPETYDFGKVDGEDVLAVLLDRRAIVVAIKMWKMGTFYVANQYKTNHWLGVEGVRGHNKFINAVAYTGESFSDFLDEGADPSEKNVSVGIEIAASPYNYASSVSVDGEIAIFNDDTPGNPSLRVIVAHKSYGMVLNNNAISPDVSFILTVLRNGEYTMLYTGDKPNVNEGDEVIFDFEHNIIYVNDTITAITEWVSDFLPTDIIVGICYDVT